MISAASLALIRTKYHAKLDTTIKISLLNGILPLGAMLGVLLVPFANKIANKKYSFIHKDGFIYYTSSLQL